MTAVIDASALVAGLLARDARGDWASGLMNGSSLTAPHLLPVEVTHAMRRLVSRGEVGTRALHLHHAVRTI